MQISTVITALAYAGVGAGVGTIGAAIIQARSSKGESRAHAADLLAEGYSGFADRLGADNKSKAGEIKSLRTVLLKLTDATDLVLSEMDTLLDNEAVQLGRAKTTALKAVKVAREANRVAKLSL